MDIDFIDRVPASPETKAGPDVGGKIDALMRSFEEYKAVNDARLEGLMQRGGGDPLVDERLARIDAALDGQRRRVDEIALKGLRPSLGRGEEIDPAAREHKAAFDVYLRRGDAGALHAAETKALSVDPVSGGPSGDGGYLVPPEVEREIGRRLADVSPIRAIAGNRVVSGSVYKKPFMTSGPAVGWVGEADARPQTDTPALTELSFPTMELYAMPAATSTLLDDAMIDVDQWLASEVDQVFAEQEGTAFVTGDGVACPKGFLTYATVANSAWEWGKLGHVTAGGATFPAEHAADVLIDLVYALRAGYRHNATFVMNRKTESVIRKFKDATTGQYLWSPGLQAGAPATLLGFPVVSDDNMPDIGANALAVAFGDFRRGYLVVDRAGVRVLRDPYTAKPYVLFYTTKRVGGGVQDFDAIKLLKFSAS
ncbi:Phage major capsid protein [Rhodovulum sp. PH10]|uniref:phage major capsid protein n=1 Tax=Rhodovulum sp. PH10 TaxID=1187851 RepID=UPI00027C2EB6|nr:phage major capsid protein [Rhodovulum sp. PH10]EJW09803.1 Phage major capsid protein [Rhodovulum sp. PH10]